MRPTILQGDVRETLKTLPSDSVHCCLTSPPYWALRSYLKADHPLKALEIGSEPTPEAFISTMVEVFREVRRVLHPSGTCWVNIGDSYASSGTMGTPRRDGRPELPKPPAAWGKREEWGVVKTSVGSIKPKDLCLIPERLALALQADGWWVRSRIAWCKRAAMPESVTDRPTSAWEHVWLLTKSARYFYDAEAVKEASTDPESLNGHRSRNPDKTQSLEGFEIRSGFAKIEEGRTYTTRNLRNFWLLDPEPFKGNHYACFPTEIPRRAILAGTSARGCCPKCLSPWERVVESIKSFESGSGKSGNPIIGKQDLFASDSNSTPDVRMGPCVQTRTIGWLPTCKCPGLDGDSPGSDCADDDNWPTIPCTVLDPFAGSGTTLAVAIELGRSAIGCELNPEYLKLIEQRTLVTPGLQLA